MADEEVQEGEEKSGGGMKKIIILAVLAIVLVAASVGGTLFFLGGKDEAATDTAAAEEDAAPTKNPAIYFPIKPPLIINFRSKGRQHLLETSITVMSRDPEGITAVQNHIRLIQSRLSMLISGEAYEDLQTDEGKELLRQKALAKVQEILEEEIGKPGIEQILFESFVMQ